jgi:hypothetical protein
MKEKDEATQKVAIYWNNTKFYINERKKQNDGGFEGLLL